MNADEYIAHVKGRMDFAPVGSLRRALYVREGIDETDRQIGRGLRAWAIERNRGRLRPSTTIVFGTCRSDALRRASAPARLGEEIHGETTDARRIVADWDTSSFAWPFEREAA